MRLNNIIYTTLFVVTLFYSCAEDYVDTQSVVSIQGVENQIIDGPTANQALLGMYSDFQSVSLYNGDMNFLLGLYTDEMIHTGSFPSLASVAGNDPNSETTDVNDMWNAYYNVIFAANNLVNSVSENLENISLEQVNSIRGQAYGLRALCYLDLVRIFGGVPLDINNERVSTDIDAVSGLERSSVLDVYTQIVDDLTNAVDLLGSIGDLPADRFDHSAALTIRAKAYIEQGFYNLAEIDLLSVVSNGHSLAPSIGQLFGTATSGSTLNSSETIFGIPFTSTDGGNLAFFFSDQPDGGRDEIGVGSWTGLFSNGADERIDLLFHPNSGAFRIAKYTEAGTGDDDVHVIRYADVLLMLAEVKARNNDATAVDYLNEVQMRSGASLTSTLDSSNFDTIIPQERILEFFGEGGDRYFTLKRLGLLDAVVQAKGGAFVPERNNLFPIPQNEIDNNSSLSALDQNPGY